MLYPTRRAPNKIQLFLFHLCFFSRRYRENCPGLNKCSSEMCCPLEVSPYVLTRQGKEEKKINMALVTPVNMATAFKRGNKIRETFDRSESQCTSLRQFIIHRILKWYMFIAKKKADPSSPLTGHCCFRRNSFSLLELPPSHFPCNIHLRESIYCHSHTFDFNYTVP